MIKQGAEKILAEINATDRLPCRDIYHFSSRLMLVPERGEDPHYVLIHYYNYN